MKYQVVYADPPWRYRDATPSRAVENHYPTMSDEEICSLKIPMDKKCVLFLWTTTAKLPEALEVMCRWGFEYKSSLVWDKVTYGMGYWFRGQHEFLLAGSRGGGQPPPASLRVRSIYSEPRTTHSRKPDAIRDLITSWYPKELKVELFARDRGDRNLWGHNRLDGWHAWGNQVEGVEVMHTDDSPNGDRSL